MEICRITSFLAWLSLTSAVIGQGAPNDRKDPFGGAAPTKPASKKPAIRHHDARTSALKAWMNNSPDEAAELLMTAYLSNADPEERDDARCAHILALLGYAEETLKRLQKVKAGDGLEEPVIKAKKARLLDVLGQTKEARELLDTMHHPRLALRLALGASDWDTAAACLEPLQSDPHKRASMNATLSALWAAEALPVQRIPGAHPTLVPLMRSMLSAGNIDSDLPPHRVATSTPSYAMLYGEALRDDDLVDMARDTEWWARKEALLLQAQAEGKPVPTDVLGEYVQYVDLIPDRERTARIATEMGKQEACTLHGREPLPQWKNRHKFDAAEGLLLLGKGKQAFEVMRPLMEALEPSNSLPTITGGNKILVSYGYERAARIAALEWPELPPAQRMDMLADVLGQDDATARATDMVDLIAKHQGAFNGEDLIKALCLPMMDVANARVAPDKLNELRGKARALFADKKPAKRFINLFERSARPQAWEWETKHRPFKGKPITKVSVAPNKGPNSAPRSANFMLIHGLTEASSLHKKGDKEAMESLLRDIVLRLLLDKSIYQQVCTWYVETRGGGPQYGSTKPCRGFVNVLQYFSMMDLPIQSTLPLVAASSEPWTNYFEPDRLLHAARICRKAGKLEQALAYHRLRLMLYLPAAKKPSRPVHMGTGLIGRGDFIEMQCVHAALAAEGDDKLMARHSILRLLKLAPYEPHFANEASEIVKQNWDEAEQKLLREGIEAFWDLRIRQIPESKTYQYWSQRWFELFPEAPGG